MKFPSLSSTLNLLKPFQKTEASHQPEKSLYDKIEEIISFTDIDTYQSDILNSFYHLTEIHQQILIVALIEHNIIDKLEIILHSSFSPNFIIRGETPLHIAVKCENLKIVMMLITHHADLELKNNFKETALSCAVQAGDMKIIEYLLTHGSNINTCASDNSTPLEQAAYSENSEAVSLLIKYGARLGASHIVKTL